MIMKKDSPVFSCLFFFLILLFCQLFSQQNSPEQNLPEQNLSEQTGLNNVNNVDDELSDSSDSSLQDEKVKLALGDRRFVDDLRANDLLTPLERYSSRTQVNIFRRTEALFFIGIPFAIFINYLLKTSFSLFSGMAAAIEEAPPSVRIPEFAYSHDNALAGTIDPFYVYTWTSNIVWPLIVALNDVIERTTTDDYTLKQKKNIRLWRFDADFMHTDF